VLGQKKKNSQEAGVSSLWYFCLRLSRKSLPDQYVGCWDIFQDSDAGSKKLLKIALVIQDAHGIYDIVIYDFCIR
jgi:hypothetical protein